MSDYTFIEEVHATNRAFGALGLCAPDGNRVCLSGYLHVLCMYKCDKESTHECWGFLSCKD